VACLHKGRGAIILFNLGVSMYMTIMKNTINKNYASEHMTGGICTLYSSYLKKGHFHDDLCQSRTYHRYDVKIKSKGLLESIRDVNQQKVSTSHISFIYACPLSYEQFTKRKHLVHKIDISFSIERCLIQDR
jgi:hypothetical protein